MLVGRILPERHLTNETKGVITVSAGVIGTLTALVLGLLIGAANSSYNTKNQEVLLIAADVIQMDHLLRRYGPEAEPLRDLLHRYTAMKIQDFFREGATKRKIAYSPRLKDKKEKLPEREPRGMSENQMRILGGMLLEASRYIGNVHSVLDKPSVDQAEEIDARLSELVRRIEAIREVL
jgi:hypothetical protein